jgi:signal peptidase I
MDFRKIKDKAKAYWKRFWYIVWEDNSLFGWIVSLLVALLIIKLIFFPAVSFVLGTSLPLVVVESNSMHHPGNFIFNFFGQDSLVELWWQQRGEWYEDRGIDFEDTKDWTLANGLEIGDVVLAIRPKNLEVGDIIIFEANHRYPLIHRIINISEVNGRTVYSTKGDNNIAQLSSEVRIPEEVIIGKAVFRVPLVGWIKLIFVKFLEIFV